MNSNKRDSDETLRQINDLSAEAEHSDVEARDALVAAEVDPDELVSGVRSSVSGRSAFARRLSNPEPRPSRLNTVLLGAIAASAAFFAISFHVNYRASLDTQRELLERWEESMEAQARTLRTAAYANRIVAGIQKLELSRDPNDRKTAIWNELLPVLVEAQKNRTQFVDVALEYQRVLPLLQVRNPDVFLDSYWGELWILNILLGSKVRPVVEAARRAAPAPSVVEAIFQKNATSLAEPDRRAFEEAMTVYANTYKGLQ